MKIHARKFATSNHEVFATKSRDTAVATQQARVPATGSQGDQTSACRLAMIKHDTDAARVSCSQLTELFVQLMWAEGIRWLLMGKPTLETFLRTTKYKWFAVDFPRKKKKKNSFLGWKVKLISDSTTWYSPCGGTYPAYIQTNCHIKTDYRSSWRENKKKS